MATPQWLLWQLADSAFPAGALAHSNGLEAAFQHRLVTTPADLEQFLGTLLQQAQHAALHFVTAAHTSPDDFECIDQRCDLFLNNHIANRASRAQARSFLAAADRIFTAPAIRDLSEKIRSKDLPAHFAPIFGLVAVSLGLDLPQTADLFLFMLARGCIGSAVRLGIVGPLEGQRIQFRIQFDQPQPQKDPVQTAPVLDLLQAAQDRLYSRLFQS